jgi:hypothetical protein
MRGGVPRTGPPETPRREGPAPGGAGLRARGAGRGELRARVVPPCPWPASLGEEEREGAVFGVLARLGEDLGGPSPARKAPRLEPPNGGMQISGSSPERYARRTRESGFVAARLPTRARAPKLFAWQLSTWCRRGSLDLGRGRRPRSLGGPGRGFGQLQHRLGPEVNP